MQDEKEKMVMDLLKLVQPVAITPVRDFKISPLIKCSGRIVEWLNSNPFEKETEDIQQIRIHFELTGKLLSIGESEPDKSIPNGIPVKGYLFADDKITFSVITKWEKLHEYLKKIMQSISYFFVKRTCLEVLKSKSRVIHGKPFYFPGLKTK